MIVGFFGDLGSGKTLSAVKLLSQLEREGYFIFTNINVSFPYTYLTIDSMIDIVEGLKKIPDKAVFCIDEITLYMDSRSLTKVTKILSYFMLQTRKLGSGEHGLIFIYTSQFPRLIDVRLWLVTSIKVVCSKVHFEKYTIINLVWFIEKIDNTNIQYDSFVADFYYNLYNTKEIIRIPKSRYDK